MKNNIGHKYTGKIDKVCVWHNKTDERNKGENSRQKMRDKLKKYRLYLLIETEWDIKKSRRWEQI